jgi:hypothetical protein
MKACWCMMILINSYWLFVLMCIYMGLSPTALWGIPISSSVLRLGKSRWLWGKNVAQVTPSHTSKIQTHDRPIHQALPRSRLDSPENSCYGTLWGGFSICLRVNLVLTIFDWMACAHIKLQRCNGGFGVSGSRSGTYHTFTSPQKTDFAVSGQKP